MERIYDTIYLSPHLDDAALSCGGQIYMQSQEGKSILIVSVMAGDPPIEVSEFARMLHGRWEIERDVVAARRSEDMLACNTLGADHLYLPFPDCIYRLEEDSGAALYNSNEALFGQVSAADSSLQEDMTAQINELPAHGRLVSPLGVGNHVDHQLTRLAAEHAQSHGLVYYEEYPYSAVPGAVAMVTAPGTGDWQVTTIPLTEEALRAKIAAISAFESQISSFFRDRADMADTIRRQAEMLGGERIWHQLSDFGK